MIPANAASIRTTARWAGALNVLSAIPDGFSVFTLRKLVVRGDAVVTAANLLGSERLFRAAFVADLVAIVIFVMSGVLLYEVFAPASRRGAMLFLVLIVMGSVFQALEAIHDLAALTLLKGGAGLSALPAAQTQAWAMIFLRLHSLTYVLGLFFFGFASLVMGYLVLRSRFVPRVLGGLMLIDGLGFLTFSSATFVFPLLATRLYPFVPFATTIGEFSLFIWLIVKSVNAERWREQAAESLSY